jgi:hypothetical protein
MNDLPFERLRSVPGRKDERIMREVLGGVDKGGEDFIGGWGRAPRGSRRHCKRWRRVRPSCSGCNSASDRTGFLKGKTPLL